MFAQQQNKEKDNLASYELDTLSFAQIQKVLKNAIRINANALPGTIQNGKKMIDFKDLQKYAGSKGLISPNLLSGCNGGPGSCCTQCSDSYYICVYDVPAGCTCIGYPFAGIVIQCDYCTSYVLKCGDY